RGHRLTLGARVVDHAAAFEHGLGFAIQGAPAEVNHRLITGGRCLRAQPFNLDLGVVAQPGIPAVFVGAAGDGARAVSDGALDGVVGRFGGGLVSAKACIADDVAVGVDGAVTGVNLVLIDGDADHCSSPRLGAGPS